MRTFSKKQKTTVAGLTLLGLAGTGAVAYGYWTTNGGGTGTASTAAGASGVFLVTGDVPLAMFPGDSAQTVTATVKNTGSESYQVQSLKAYLTVDAAHATAGCGSSDYLLNGVAAPGTAAGAADLSVTPVDLAPGATTTKDFTVQFNNKPTAQDFCKGASVTVNYVAG